MGDVVSGVSGLLGSAGNVVGGFLGADAVNDATKTQSDALQQIIDYTQKNLDPALVNKQAVQADIDRAKARLNLQQQIDPELARQRQVSQQLLSGQLAGLGAGASDLVSNQAAMEAMKAQPGFDQAKQNLIDAALAESKGVLPPSIQAQLMQSGLEQAGAVTGAARGQGAGGVILNKVLGLGGLQLQQNAANLLTTAGALDAQRQQTLQNLFPRLQQQQLGNISAASGILQQSNQMVPEAGLSGSDIANIWLARVGAINQLASNKAGIQAQGNLMSGLLQSKAIGGAISAVPDALSGVGSLSNFFKSTNPGIGASGNFAA